MILSTNWNDVLVIRSVSNVPVWREVVVCMTLVSFTLVNYLRLFLTNLLNHRNQTISVFFIFHSCIWIWNFVLMSALIHACPWNVLLFEGWYVPMHNEQFYHEQQITGDKTWYFPRLIFSTTAWCTGITTRTVINFFKFIITQVTSTLIHTTIVHK